MASSEEADRVAAAKQLGSMSLGESADRKENETETTTKNGTSTMCSACETKSDALKKCTACKCVWYCDKDCQNKHWKEHKKECKLIKKVLDKRGGKLELGTEEDIGPLGKLPQREECQICFRVLPVHESLQTYAYCCGKTLCSGCDFQHNRKSREQAVTRTCAFCREPVSGSDEKMFLPTLPMTKVPRHKVGNDLIHRSQAQTPSIRTGSGVGCAEAAERVLHRSPGRPLSPLKINIDMGKVRFLGERSVPTFGGMFGGGGQFGKRAVLLSSSSRNIVGGRRQEEVRCGDQGLNSQYGQEAMPVASIIGMDIV